nr:hypothetical protein [Mucilaginibacter sp. SP1R1]
MVNGFEKAISKVVKIPVEAKSARSTESKKNERVKNLDIKI